MTIQKIPKEVIFLHKSETKEKNEKNADAVYIMTILQIKKMWSHLQVKLEKGKGAAELDISFL